MLLQPLTICVFTLLVSFSSPCKEKTINPKLCMAVAMNIDLLHMALHLKQ